MGTELTARACAALIVADVLKGRSLTESLGHKTARVKDSDRAFVSELAYGSCRWWYRLDTVAGKLSNKPFKKRDQDIRALLTIGLYQLEFTRVPAHAAVAETAGAARGLGKPWAVSVINAILRRYQREREALQQVLSGQPSYRYAQPDWLVNALRRDWPEQWPKILEGLLQKPPFTLRVNLQRIELSRYAGLLAQSGLTARPVPGVPSALVLDRAVVVDQLPGFGDGLVSVQDAGAQLAAHILQPERGDRVLDACAAPGGKTGHLFEWERDIRLTAVDVDASRLQSVDENMQRLGYEPVLVVGDASNPEPGWASGQFDRILVDAPCTATGVIRRHPDIKLLRRADDVVKLADRQKNILNSLWSLLKPGGKMLYATCSLLAMENELQMKRFVEHTKDAEIGDLGGYPGHVLEHGLQTLPGEHEMDGFYYSLITKKA